MAAGELQLDGRMSGTQAGHHLCTAHLGMCMQLLSIFVGNIGQMGCSLWQKAPANVLLTKAFCA